MKCLFSEVAVSENHFKPLLAFWRIHFSSDVHIDIPNYYRNKYSVMCKTWGLPSQTTLSCGSFQHHLCGSGAGIRVPLVKQKNSFIYLVFSQKSCTPIWATVISGEMKHTDVLGKCHFLFSKALGQTNIFLTSTEEKPFKKPNQTNQPPNSFPKPVAV